MLCLALIYLISCEDEKYVSSADVKLMFSADTVMFDTIFTTVGSTTQNFKIYNQYDQKILISSVKLAGGVSSNFRLNVNGIASNEVHQVEIAPHDSIYIFVEVTVDPTGENLPMVVKDSIEFMVNSNLQYVNLFAWGQDFNLVRSAVIKNTTTWSNEKPYLIYDYAYVDSTAVLKIKPGTKIYCHKDAGLYVKGKILAEGTLEQPIVFQGDRLESAYQDVPNQWSQILLYSGSYGNVFENVEIKNANIGLQVGTVEHNGYASVSLKNVKILSMAYAGIFSLKSEILASNCLIANCGYYAAALLVGGNYEFYHTTIANYWGKYKTRERSTSSLVISNLLKVSDDKVYIGNINKAFFANCIIDGNVIHGNELQLAKTEEAEFNYRFDHCLLQVADTFKTSDQTRFQSIVRGKKPRYVDVDKLKFELDTLSPVKDIGKADIARLFPTDIKGVNRLSDQGPDLGAYERVEKK